VDPISITNLVKGPEWQVPGIGDDIPSGTGEAAAGSGSQFGSMLANTLGKLNDTVNASSTASDALATGQASDVTSVVMQTERASLELQLATQFRNKAVEAYQDIFRMQI
jgi:flagellar hook-basal body complex protein FliE